MKAEVILYKSKKLAKGRHPLVLRITEKYKRKYYTLGVNLPAIRWNTKKNCYKPIPILEGMTPDEIKAINKENADIIAIVESTNSKYAAKIRELLADGKTITIDSLREIVEKPIKKNYTVFQWFDELIKGFKKLDKLGQVRAYQSALGALKTFQNGQDITFDEIDLAFLHRFERHLQLKKYGRRKTDKAEKHLSNASISVYMRTLRAAINQAIVQEYTKNYPFQRYSIPKGEPHKRALSVEDMELLINKDQDNDNFKMMLFSYYTVGMNYVDMVRLKWSNIVGNEIRYTRQKIHHRMSIPIHPKVSDILNYYKPKTGNAPQISGKNDNYIFPVLNAEIHKTEQQIADRVQKTRKYFNDYLRTLGEAAGVDEHLTSYVLRHSAITHLVRKGVTIDAIKVLAGHAKISTTENYFKDSDEQKTKAVNML